MLDEIVNALNLRGEEQRALHQKARALTIKNVGANIYLRALIEFSNICKKDCYYCGIRSSNKKVSRYQLSFQRTMEIVENIYRAGINSIVIQSGEEQSENFIKEIESILYAIKDRYADDIRVTLSCGEQSKECYHRWFLAGAKRYLLRFESSSEKIYNTIHPNNNNHNFNARLNSLKDLKDIGYQVGSGFMIGFPGQRIEDIANDLLFLKMLDVDMVGMGPYIEHRDTPLYARKEELLSPSERLSLGLNSIAVLRQLMKDINIASTTALESLHPQGKILGLKAGANVVMLNFTYSEYEDKYSLYENKSKARFASYDSVKRSLEQISIADQSFIIDPKQHGDSLHYKMK
ncbi:MAG: [FeFe] hydrogenase H-cluster radical SAM maturase HydE [Oligoflexia bacterium]|nr:[FeFe] hydrogenase H-cluster radical SAM maturase HydE [Oligoflexia bacterium]